MKEIIYKGKNIRLPFEGADYGYEFKPNSENNLDDSPMIEVANRFSGVKTKLPAFAVAVYDVIMGSEQFQDWDKHRKGLDWFIEYFPNEYMVLLD